MGFFSRKRTVFIVLFIIALCIGVFVIVRLNKTAPEPAVEAPKKLEPIYKVIGTSVQNRKIEAYTYSSPAGSVGGATSIGAEAKHLLFVGGMHGGYEWNSVLLSYQFLDYLDKNLTVIPENITVTVIPSLNPDGVFKVTGKEGRFGVADASTDKEILASGRFNEHEVDLNRNFDCKWKSTSKWQNKTVSAGPEPFSEPEAEALRVFVFEKKPDAVIFWHSQANAVYASECEHGILPGTLDIMNAYSKAAGYPAIKSFDSYAVTGDAEGWLASINIPAITVELKTHETVEWEKNLAGIKALFEYYR